MTGSSSEIGGVGQATEDIDRLLFGPLRLLGRGLVIHPISRHDRVLVGSEVLNIQ